MMEFTPEEELVVQKMAKDLDVPVDTVMRMALRHFQLCHERMLAGETMHFSGDFERAKGSMKGTN